MHYLILQLHKIKPELLELPGELESVSKSSDSKFYDYISLFVSKFYLCLLVSISGISAELEGLSNTP